jgi:hypothetical protein
MLGKLMRVTAEILWEKYIPDEMINNNYTNNQKYFNFSTSKIN